MMKNFIGSTIETEGAPERRDRYYVYIMIKNIKVAYGKNKKDGKINKRDEAPIDGVPLKMSIFFKYHLTGQIWACAIPSMACI